MVFATEILQILSNFILNSFDALPTEGGILRVRVKGVGDCVHVTVADNGSGMSDSGSLPVVRRHCFLKYMSLQLLS
ncbi:ATP-binding protein [Edaphobacter aggregans]|uniref:ATP-binding protein n=1 Tax=Edaphobacter aggregans TaxID=570835 RepID=UPI003CCB8188